MNDFDPPEPERRRLEIALGARGISLADLDRLRPPASQSQPEASSSARRAEQRSRLGHAKAWAFVEH